MFLTSACRHAGCVQASLAPLATAPMRSHQSLTGALPTGGALLDHASLSGSDDERSPLPARCAGPSGKVCRLRGGLRAQLAQQALGQRSRHVPVLCRQPQRVAQRMPRDARVAEFPMETLHGCKAASQTPPGRNLNAGRWRDGLGKC